METMVAFLILITLHRADGAEVSISPRHITSVTPARDHGHFTKGVHCIIHTDDRKFIAVKELCSEVHMKLKRRT
jgi:hypothetical protein